MLRTKAAMLKLTSSTRECVKTKTSNEDLVKEPMSYEVKP